MIILKEKKIARKGSVREGATIVKSTWSEFVSSIETENFNPNRLEIYQTTTTRFHIALKGKFETDAQTTFVDFVSKGQATTIISVSENDVVKVEKWSGIHGDYYRLVLKNNLFLSVSEI